MGIEAIAYVESGVANVDAAPYGLVKPLGLAPLCETKPESTRGRSASASRGKGADAAPNTFLDGAGYDARRA